MQSVAALGTVNRPTFIKLEILRYKDNVSGTKL